MNDPELFDLCKEVYKRTGWQIEDSKWFCLKNHTSEPEYEIEDYPIVSSAIADGNIPLYTSDYLLEKLPANIVSKVYPDTFAQLWLRKQQDEDEPEKTFAYYAVMSKPNCVSDFGVYADTPLKSLLKLVIALDDAGELQVGSKR